MFHHNKEARINCRSSTRMQNVMWFYKCIMKYRSALILNNPHHRQKMPKKRVRVQCSYLQIVSCDDAGPAECMIGLEYCIECGARCVVDNTLAVMSMLQLVKWLLYGMLLMLLWRLVWVRLVERNSKGLRTRGEFVNAICIPDTGMSCRCCDQGRSLIELYMQPGIDFM